MRNTGATTWESGYQLVFKSGEQMGASSAVDVPATSPGQEVNISVNLTAPTDGGAHVGYWQMRNPQGTFFGDIIWVNINVDSGSNYITVLTADPPSPSDNDEVIIHTLVENFPNFRAMRLKIDGSVVYEIGAPEFYYPWNTNGYAVGEHSLVVEVASQTDTSWSHPESRGMTYALEGTSGSSNHAPYRPVPVANPAYDWYVTIGSPPQLCAQEQGDPDGDPITHYRFVASASVGTVDSGWVGSSCHTFASVTPGTYEWHAQVRDNGGAVSDWSDIWHFTVSPPGVTAYIDHFSPGSPSAAEEVEIYGCSSGHGGENITLRVLVNDANDGTDSGQWHIIKEQGSPCFNSNDVPIWRTLEYADGPHLVRVVAMAIQPDAGDIHDEVYTLNHRRPASTRLVAPVPPSENISEPVYLNSRTITFRWESTIRAQGFTLHVSTNPSPKDDPNPIFRQVLSSTTTEYTYTFSQDYPTLYWQATANNDVGTNASGDQRFGIDRVAPTCAVQQFPDTTYESVFQVNWGGVDSLAGVRTFDIQYLDSDHGGWNDWLTSVPVTKTFELFTGQPGHSYGFRCRATDFATNTGNYPNSADTSILIDPSTRPPTPWWDANYSEKRNLIILNNMVGETLPVSYPVHLHFDSTTTPTAAELYVASQSNPKCNDLRIVHDDTTELDRVVQNCSSSNIDIWFRSQVVVPGGTSDTTAHQLYYGNPGAGSPPGSPTTVFDPPLDGNTVGLWYMHEGSGSTLSDYSGLGNNCTIDPTTTWITPAKFSGALQFLGGTDGATVNCGTSSVYNLQAFTVEMFLRRPGTAWGRLAGHLGNNQNRWLMTFNGNGTVKVTIWPCSTCGSEEFDSNTAIGNTNEWHHVAFSLENSTVNIYIDGQLDATGQVAAGNINSGTPPLTIGSAENIMRTFAEITHVRFSNVARSNFQPYAGFSSITSEPSVVAGDTILPPTQGTPDLALLSLTAYPNPSGGVLIQAVVENQGDKETQNGFFTDLYIDHEPAGPGDYNGSIQFWVNESVEAGETITLTTVIDNPYSSYQRNIHIGAGGELRGTFYGQTDSTGAVGEDDNANNIYSNGIEICVAEADEYETDDTRNTATPLAINTYQTHNIHRVEDEDWFSIQATAGDMIRIRTANLDYSADTYLYLYASDGTTLLASDDDYNGSLASQIEWTASSTGMYYVKVKHWNPNVSGCGTSYTIIFGDIRVYLPIIQKP